MLFNISDSSGIGEARRASLELARGADFSETDRGRLAIVITELGTNILKHARQGILIVQHVAQELPLGIEVLAIDSGPGNPNIERCLQDGYSTSGTPGNGLGAIRRQSEVFDIHSQEGLGTVVLAQLWPGKQMPNNRQYCPNFGAISDPYPGEPVCGDGWTASVESGRVVVLVADGLGHGVMAHESSNEAIRVFARDTKRNAVETIEAIHHGIKQTRGCAVAVVEMDLSLGVANYCGIGNIAGSIISGNIRRNMVSLNGIAGHNVRKTKDFQYPCSGNATLVMHSDGIDTRWELNAFTNIEHHHPSLIAGAIFRGHRRSRDDATIVVMKTNRGS